MKKIFIGIDVSKEKFDATAISCVNQGSEVTELGYSTFENRPKGFRSLLAWAKTLSGEKELDDVLFCCETTGGYDHALCDYIFAHSCDIWRESALQIKLSSGVRKGKDDRADSRTIAEYAMRHLDKCSLYSTPDKNIVKIKALLLYRRKLEQERTSKRVRANELKALMDDDEVSRFIYRDAMKSIRQLEKSMAEVEKRIKDIIESVPELSRNYGHVMSVKGIGPVNATALIAFTNNFKNFPTSRKLCSYYGVASFREKSGSSIDKKAYVANLSSTMLKSYISEAAGITVFVKAGIYQDYYARMAAQGKPHLLIMNNIKNKLLHLVFSLVQNDCDYEYNHEFMRHQRIDGVSPINTKNIAEGDKRHVR